MKRLLFLFLLLLITLPNAAFGWQRHSFGSIEKPIYLRVGDLDEDGDLDVAAGSGSSGEPINSEVAWFENDIDNSSSFIKGIISPAIPTSEAIQNAEGIDFADVDKDGQKDVVVATGRMGNQYGGSYWFKSPLNFQGQWTRYPIYDPTSGNSFYKVYAIDANEDTWPDFVIGGDSGAYIYFNPTNPTDPLATWDQLLLDPYTGPSVNLADVNNDGKMDILNTNTGIAPPETVGNVSWIKIINDGGDVSVVRTVIDSALKMAFDISAMDITGDSYPEVFVSIFNPPGQKNKGIYWYENPGPENGLWIKNVLDPVFEASDIYIGDIDGDGQDDLVASALFKNKISWFGYEWVAGTAVWTEHVVDPEVNRPGDISLNDFDGDGDMDIVVAVLNDHEMVWYENEGLFNSIPCFAESIYGEHSKEAELLRDFRDNVLSKTHEGRETIKLYYEWSPSIVEVMEKNAELRENLKIVIDEKLPLIKEKLE